MTELIIRITSERAQECEDGINNHINNTRALLVELYEGEAWIVRGFSNWRNYVVAKFGHHESHLYRLLNAGLLERELSPNGEIGNIPESQLREVGKLDDPLLRKAAWEVAQDEEKVTARIVKQAVSAAAEWANEYIQTKGFTSLESQGQSLEVAKVAITDRMIENRNRQLQHIADSVDGKYKQTRIVNNVPFTIVSVLPSSNRIVLNLGDATEVVNQILALFKGQAKDLRLSIAQPITDIEAEGIK